MLRKLFPALIVAMIALTACNNNHKGNDSSAKGSADSLDTLQLCRTANDGTDGKIYGSVTYNERYALTTRDNGDAIGVLINLTELDRKLKDYEIRNGWLIVSGDTVSPSKYLN